MQKLILLFTAICLAGATNAQKTMKLFVAEQTVMCPGNYSAECLLVKEKKKSEYAPLAAGIENFTYEAGYEYTLKVSKSDKGAYTLVKALKKKKTTYNPAERIDMKRWFLHSLHDDTTYINLLDTTKVYLEINLKEKRVSGKGICNRFSGGITVNGTDITITALASTKMACEGVKLEAIVTGMLQNMKRFKVVGNTLTLSGDNKDRLVFKLHKDYPLVD